MPFQNKASAPPKPKLSPPAGNNKLDSFLAQAKPDPAPSAVSEASSMPAEESTGTVPTVPIAGSGGTESTGTVPTVPVVGIVGPV